jgi:hypothetical protein
VGNRGRAAIVALPTLAVLGAFALILLLDPSSLFGSTPDPGLLTSLLILDLMLALYHLWAVLDAYVLARKARPDRLLPGGSPRKWVTVLSVGVLVAGTVGVHAAVAEVSISWQHGLSCNTEIGRASCRERVCAYV